MQQEEKMKRKNNLANQIHDMSVRLRNEEIEKTRLNNKFFLKIVGMIICGVLGLVDIIGIFWGKEGFMNLGIGICFAFIIAVIIIINIPD